MNILFDFKTIIGLVLIILLLLSVGFFLLWNHHGSYAWSANDTMALDFEYGNTEEEYKQTRAFAQKVVDCINGLKPLDMPLNWGVYNGIDFCYDGEYVFCVRGWGHLTGIGGLNLPWKEAQRIQDEFVKYILEKFEGK